MDREDIRVEIKNRRINMRREEVEAKSLEIQKELFSLEEFVCSKTVTFYAAKKKHNEVETEQMIRDSLDMEKRVIVPITDRKNKVLVFSEIKSYDELFPKTFGIPEPKADCIRSVQPYDTNLIIVPCIVVDMCGFRLGYGKGYYDKFLAVIMYIRPRIPTIGLAYEYQIHNFPRGLYDRPVDKVITEKRVIDCLNFRNA